MGRLNRLPHPFFAGFKTLLAGVGALLAVVVLVLPTFLRAELANFHAFLHDVAGMRGIPPYKARGERADVRAVPVEHNAFDHHFYIFLLEAEGGAGFAGRYALDQYVLEVVCFF
jgi:hypothetical protein